MGVLCLKGCPSEDAVHTEGSERLAGAGGWGVPGGLPGHGVADLQQCN